MHHLEPLDDAIRILNQILRPKGQLLIIEENGNNIIQNTKLFLQRGNKKIIEIINNYLLKKIKIDYTFLHIVNKKNLNKRMLKRKNLNRYDKFNYSFYQKVQNGFIKMANLNKTKYLIVNSNKKINENKTIIINKINKLLNI